MIKHLILIALVIPILAYSDPTTRVDRARELLSIIENNKIDRTVSLNKTGTYQKIESELSSENQEEAKLLADVALESFKEELYECTLDSNQDDAWRITRAFTETEVEELILFYSSPLGKKLHSQGGLLKRHQVGYSEKLTQAGSRFNKRVLEILNNKPLLMEGS